MNDARSWYPPSHDQERCVMTRTIAALFDTVEAAEKAARDLAEQVGGVHGTIYGPRTSSDVDTIEAPSEDRPILQEHIRRGGAVLHAQIPDEKFEAVYRVVEANGAVDCDEREATWRREGWTGWSGTAATGAGGKNATETARRGGGIGGAGAPPPLAEEP